MKPRVRYSKFPMPRTEGRRGRHRKKKERGGGGEGKKSSASDSVIASLSVIPSGLAVVAVEGEAEGGKKKTCRGKKKRKALGFQRILLIHLGISALFLGY